MRPYALKGSPYLRPPVGGSVVRLSLERLPGVPLETLLAGGFELVASAVLKADHDRSVCEFDVHCGVVKDCQAIPIFVGSAWCIATKLGTQFEPVVVPPVPLDPQERNERDQRYKGMKQRKTISVVKASAAELPRTAEAARLSLTLHAERSINDNMLASALSSQGKCARDAAVPVQDACGDPGPLIAAGLRLAQELASAAAGGEARQVERLEAECTAIPHGIAVQLSGRAGGGGDPEEHTVLVTGWLNNKPVMRLRVAFR